MSFSLLAPLTLVEPTLTTPEKVILAFLCVLAWVLFFVFLGQKLAKVRLGGVDVRRLDRIPERLLRVIRDVFLQYRVIAGRPIVGTMHSIVFLGFLAFLLEKAYHFPHAFGFVFPRIIIDFYNIFLGKFLFAVGAAILAAVAGFMVRRGILRPKTLTRTPDAWYILTMISVIMITFMVPFFGGNQVLVNISQWIQNITILTFLVYIPKSKHLHLLFCPVNEFIRNFDIGRLRTTDLENEEKEDFGIGTIKNFSWKDLLDSYTCIQCGRCNDACPAAATDKSLKPRDMVLGIQHGLEEGKVNEKAIGTAISETALWECTTCTACEHSCPVGIEHPSKIVGMRRWSVQVDTECPEQAQVAFQNLEAKKNIFGIDPGERARSIKDTQSPIFTKGTEYLLWMGCFANYDQGYRQTAIATAALLRKAGVSFGILENEICCGDPARRLGNEFLYQEMAGKSIKQMQELGVKKVITACPHCAVTIGRDWHDLGAAFEVTHHTVFIKELIDTGKITLKQGAGGSAVFHDPCYLSRYLKSTSEPRNLLVKAGYAITEAKQHGENSFCCGGGGGLAFLEEHEGTRINRMRFAQLQATGAKTIAVGCPYCYTMLKDARGDAGADSTIALNDVSVLVEKAMVS